MGIRERNAPREISPVHEGKRNRKRPELRTAILLLIFLAVFRVPAWTQSASSQSTSDDFVSSWFRRSSRAESEQPHWAAPLFTVTPRLVQQFGYDMGWQLTNGFTNANYGGDKGLELSPSIAWSSP